MPIQQVSTLNHPYQSLAAMFQDRVVRTPDRDAYLQYCSKQSRWESFSWRQISNKAARAQGWLGSLGLSRGDRIALMLHNGIDWVILDQAAAGLGLVTVPMFVNDRAGNLLHIMKTTRCRLLALSGNSQWNTVRKIQKQLPDLEHIVCMDKIPGEEIPVLSECLEKQEERVFFTAELDPGSLATIVFTSGTTGRPKGVMLSHNNIICNVIASTKAVSINSEDRMLSFLPLSHMFERTVGYYAPMLHGAEVAYARSIEKIAEDLLQLKPTVLVSVPRIYERMHKKICDKINTGPIYKRLLFSLTLNIGYCFFQYRQKQRGWSPKLLFHPLLSHLVSKKIQDIVGGRLRYALSGGAPLSEEISRFFVSLGLNILQGYGMTECSPVVSANREDNNILGSVGRAMPGLDVKTSETEELLVRGHSVMLGYWENPQATAETVDNDGWLHTGDLARITNGIIYITGRAKEIIVLSTGEKIAPADIESAICKDNLFDQAIVIGEKKPFLSAIVVLNPDNAGQLESKNSEDREHLLLDRIKHCLANSPGYAQIYRVHATNEAWTVENELLTPTLKYQREKIVKLFTDEIEAFYQDH